MASTSAVVPSVKCTVRPSTWVRIGFSLMPSGQSKPIGPLRDEQMTSDAPYFHSCDAMSSAE